jgi:hypothetical protein
VGLTAGTHENFLPLKEIEATSLCHPTSSLVPILPTAPFTKYSHDQTGKSMVAVYSTQGGHDKIATVGTYKGTRWCVRVVFIPPRLA